ncbi:unnamed protein product, partial [Timema podura]|nr:unnamed protein product [Timema podura]
KKEVGLHVSHSSLISSDRMKPRSGDWAVTIDFLQETAIISLPNGSNMLDMIHPATPGKISLSDLKQCKMTSIFFDTFFNLEKYLDHEQRDPFASQREHDTDGQELSDWDRYAAEEYELLVAEEGSNDQQEDMLYEDDDTEGEDALSPNLDNIITNNNDSESKSEHWKKPSFTVTDFDMDDEDDDDSADYAADSDDCSL